MIQASTGRPRAKSSERQLRAEIESQALSARCKPAQRIMELALDYVPNPQFSDVSLEADILAEIPAGNAPGTKTRPPAKLPAYLASLYDVPLLSREQEVHLFRKFNYLKYKASTLRSQHVTAGAAARDFSVVNQLYEESVNVKNQIVRANLRLVVSIAKKYVGSRDTFFELISDGNMSLIQAVEKFDFALGYRFSTYASWAIINNFARSTYAEHRHRDRFRTSTSDLFYDSEESRSDEYEQETAQRQRELQVRKLLGRLDDREQRVVIRHFGLQRGDETHTLEAIGAELGVSKERIRQIEAKALNKLRAAVHEAQVDFFNGA